MKNSVCVQNFQRIKKEKEGRLGCLYFHTIEKKGASTIFSVPFCHTKARLSFSFLQEKNIMPFLSAVSENGIFGSYGMSKLCIDGIFHFCFIHFKSVQKCSIIIFECFGKMNPALCINLIEFATHVPGGMCCATVGYSV